MSKITDIKTKAMKILKEVFSKEEIVMLQEQVADSNKTEEEKEKIEMAKEITTADGKKLKVEGELVVGSKVMEVTEAGEVNASGTYEIEEGTLIVVDGLITEMKAKEAVIEPIMPDPMLQLAAHKKDFEVQLSKQKESFNKEIAALKETNKVLLSFMNKIIETPIEVSHNKEKTSKPFEEMTKKEQLLFTRGKL